jgi:NTP pyrophosphatase (non-canonical NTP hydrolase)
MINELAKQVHENAIKKGFYEDGQATNMGERIALLHSECSEALEADREGNYYKPDIDLIYGLQSEENFEMEYKLMVKGTFEEEMADIVIRVMDMCAWKGIDLEGHIKAKMRYNKTRPKKHGKKY